MAHREEELRTKDKKQIDHIYRILKKYVLYVGADIRDVTSTGKESRIEWITSVFNNRTVLKEIISDVTINEYCCIEKEQIDDWGGMYNYGYYWVLLGLLNTVYDEDSAEFFAYFIRPLADLFEVEGEDLYKELGLRATVNSTVCAMVNLYGIVSFEKAYDIFCHVTSLGEKISYNRFMEIAVRFSDFRKEYNICVYMNSFVSADYLEVKSLHEIQKITPKPEYYELVCKQGDKPFYTDFNIEKLLKYAAPGSFEINSYIDDFMLFLSDTFNRPDKDIFEITDMVCKACIDENGINFIFELLQNKGFSSKSQKIQKLMVKHIMQIKNNVRLRTNRGFTINELRAISYDATICCSNL